MRVDDGTHPIKEGDLVQLIGHENPVYEEFLMRFFVVKATRPQPLSSNGVSYLLFERTDGRWWSCRDHIRKIYPDTDDTQLYEPTKMEEPA